MAAAIATRYVIAAMTFWRRKCGENVGIRGTFQKCLPRPEFSMFRVKPESAAESPMATTMMSKSETRKCLSDRSSRVASGRSCGRNLQSSLLSLCRIAARVKIRNVTKQKARAKKTVFTAANRTPSYGEVVQSVACPGGAFIAGMIPSTGVGRAIIDKFWYSQETPLGFAQRINVSVVSN